MQQQISHSSKTAAHLKSFECDKPNVSQLKYVLFIQTFAHFDPKRNAIHFAMQANDLLKDAQDKIENEAMEWENCTLFMNDFQIEHRSL